MLDILNKYFEKSKFEKDVKQITSFSLSVICHSFLVFLSWNYFGFGILIYIYSLFIAINKYRNLDFKRFIFNIIKFSLILHLGVLFWMFNIKYGIIGFLISLIYYTIPFIIYFIFNKFIKKNLFVLIPIYLLFELALENVNFAFPWLTIGNSLSNSLLAPQLYEYIGSLGGSFIILFTAYLIILINQYKYKLLIVSFVIGIFYSFGYYSIRNQKQSDQKQKFNYLFFDPNQYETKNKYYSNNDIIYHVKKNINNKKYDKIFIPELTLKSISFKNFEKSLLFDYIKEMCSNTNSKIYFGASGVVQKGKLSNVFVCTDGINTNLKLKEKLVPYSEYTPNFLRDILNRNISFDYAVNNLYPKSINDELFLICYEVVYSSYISKNINNNNLIILLTSEKFFNDSYFGMNQYNNLIRLRAIENRKPIIKSSNAGDSFFVDKFGIITKSCKGEFCTFSIDKNKINNSNNSFYSNYIVKFSIYLYLNVLLIIFIFFKK